MPQLDNISSDSKIDYLFGPRLSLFATQDQLLLKCKVPSSSNLHDFTNKRLADMEPFLGELKSIQDISNAYGVFYSLIYSFRFDQKGVL